jgi:hypothetical protein
MGKDEDISSMNIMKMNLKLMLGSSMNDLNPFFDGVNRFYV